MTRDARGRFSARGHNLPPPREDAARDLHDSFLSDLLALWRADGRNLLSRLAEEKPDVLLRVYASFVPKEKPDKASELTELSDTDLESHIEFLLGTRRSRGARASPARSPAADGDDEASSL